MEGAAAQLAKLEWALKLKKATKTATIQSGSYELLKKFENRERDYIPTITPGSIFKVANSTTPIRWPLVIPNYYYTLKQDAQHLRVL
jgi:hypothetical protein